MTTETTTELRRCIGSTRFGIEAHEAPRRRLPRPAQPEGRPRADVQAPLARVHERAAQGRGGAEVRRPPRHRPEPEPEVVESADEVVEPADETPLKTRHSRAQAESADDLDVT